MRLIITGGAGFIGSTLVRRALELNHDVLTVDKLTYAGNLAALSGIMDSPRHSFIQADVASSAAMDSVFRDYDPDAVLHLAAESHVDRSIDNPADFINTNVFGTFILLETALRYWSRLSSERQLRFRYVQISTDEVFGSLGAEGIFNLESKYAPNSPYAATKAAADHLARAWHQTYKLPVITTNCSNNFGPRQHGEKLIPTVIRNAIQGKPIPVYGDGLQSRDWIYVADHANGLLKAVDRGMPGDTYLFGGRSELRNIDLVCQICAELDALSPRADEHSYAEQISFVTDRPGHDYRYSVDSSYAESTLDWTIEGPFDVALRKTIQWYLANMDWLTLTGFPDRLGTRYVAMSS